MNARGVLSSSTLVVDRRNGASIFIGPCFLKRRLARQQRASATKLNCNRLLRLPEIFAAVAAIWENPGRVALLTAQRGIPRRLPGLFSG
jgi:hypothetical protein